jgi:small subunit ribosomal protein S27Ae
MMAGKDDKKAPAKGGAAPAAKKGLSQKVPYAKEGDKLVKKNKECPKCGAGVFMASHKDRWACGKCRYTEFRKQ